MDDHCLPREFEAMKEVGNRALSGRVLGSMLSSNASLWLGGSLLAFCVLGARSSDVVPARVQKTEAITTPGIAPLSTGGCPPGTAPDGETCVHLASVDDGPLAESRANTHHDRSGRLTTYDQIPRLPERPADYDAYVYPIPPGLPNGHYVVSGYDLDRPDDKQRRGATLTHVGHGAVDLPQAKGTPVRMIALEHQEGDAEVLFTGGLFGTTILTRHTLREGGQVRDYVMLFGHLDSIAPGVAPGAILKQGQVIAAVGDTASPRLVHLHLEVRRVRDGVDLAKVPAGGAMIGETVSVVCDPRNVLPLR